MDKIKGFKTFLLGATVVLGALWGDETVKTYVTANYEVVGSIIGGLIIALRAMTSSPIFKK